MKSTNTGVRRLLTSARTRAALSLGVVLAVGVTGTFAYWTDSVTVGGTTFTSGTIDLKIKDSGGTFQDAVSGYTSLTLTTMVPGNTTAGLVVIKNSGTVPMKYTALTAASNGDSKGLRGALTVKVTGDTSVTGTSPAAACAGAALPNTTSTLNTGLLTTGRLLAAGASETLCVQVTLPAGVTDPLLQNATTNVDFTFTGTSDLS